nr:hypothetical protein [Tanacetum cinerariifolium]
DSLLLTPLCCDNIHDVTPRVFALARWAKSSTSVAWSLGLRMKNIELTQAGIESDIASPKQETSEIKSMMTEILDAFKGQSSSASSKSVSTTTLAITEGPSTVG